MRSTRELVQMANRLFYVDYIPPHIRRHNRRQWLRSVQLLGSKWLIAESLEFRKEAQNAGTNP